MKKKYALEKWQFLDLVPPMGACLATDRVTVDGETVGYMYREAPDENRHILDSGWRFFAGDEDAEYTETAANFSWFTVNDIANFDRAIIPYLSAEYGTSWVRQPGTDWFEEEPFTPPDSSPPN